MYILIYLFKVYFFILRERETETERASKGGAEREMGREIIASRLCTLSTEPNAGFKPMNHEIMT